MKYAPIIGALVGAVLVSSLVHLASRPSHPCEELHKEFQHIADLLAAGERGAELWAAMVRRDRLLTACGYAMVRS